MTIAFVLCGGKGTRLRPYTYSIPKPMLPLGKRPILEFVIGNLANSGVTDLVLAVGYLSEQIISHFGDGSKFGVKITYSKENEEQNTAGAILAKKGMATGTFVVVMGDHLTNVSISELLSCHKKSGCIATIGLKKTGVPLDYGIAHLRPDGKISDFSEKPIVENLVNAGVYAFEPEILDYIKPKDDFAKNVFPSLLSAKKDINSYVFDSYWVDIGRMEDYESIHKTISILDIALHHHSKK
jgi:mannose-1-phosphate guanylyltransferase/phosphomannomutase